MVEAWGEDDIVAGVRLTCGAKWQRQQGKAGRRAGVGDTRWAACWAGRASWAGLLLRAGGASRLLCAGGPSRPSLLWVCFPSLSFSVLFSSPLFDFKFGLKFEFQFGAPYSLEF